MHYTYLLASQQNGQWYIGSTSDLRDRMQRHNQGRNISTKSGRPWKLIYYEAYLDKRDSIGREKFLKSGSGRKFLKKQIRHYIDMKEGR